MAWSDTIVSAGFNNLTKFQFPVFPTCVGITRLQKAPSPTATEIVGSIGLHVDKVFLSHNAFDHKTKIFCNGIAKGFSNQLTRILNRKFYFEISIPVGTDFEFSLPDPSGIIFDNAFCFEIVSNIEFFESDPDCKKLMPSLCVEPYLASKIIHGFSLKSYNLFPFFQVGTEQAIVFRRPSFGTISPIGPDRMQNFP